MKSKIYLFVHQSFPGQYLHVVRHLLENPANQVHFIAQTVDTPIAGVSLHLYAPDLTTAPHCHPLTLDFDSAVANGAAVMEKCRQLRDMRGLRPDLIVGHSGWGEMLFVKDVFPDTSVLTYFEFYYHASGVDIGFDPEFSSLFGEPARLRVRNAISLMSFDAADWGHTPTLWQRSLLPPELRQRVTVLHEGVDTDRVCPREGARFQLPDGSREFHQGEEIITYVSRNLEPYRGFHVFARAMPEILRRRPEAQIIIVGEDGQGYGSAAPPGSNYREMLLAEVGADIDLQRVHFIPKLPYDDYIRLLQVSAAHVYLTYPFVLSWSFLEAMSAGCLVIGSSTPPVMEFLEDGVNGLAVDFFQPTEIAERIDEVFAHPDRLQGLRVQARRMVVKNFDLKRVQLRRWTKLFDTVAKGKLPDLDPQPTV